MSPKSIFAISTASSGLNCGLPAWTRTQAGERERLKLAWEQEKPLLKHRHRYISKHGRVAHALLTLRWLLYRSFFCITHLPSWGITRGWGIGNGLGAWAQLRKVEGGGGWRAEAYSVEFHLLPQSPEKISDKRRCSSGLDFFFPLLPSFCPVAAYTAFSSKNLILIKRCVVFFCL
jgi:hypothetical protein